MSSALKIKKKILPQRKNRGSRMAILAKNEEQLIEDKQAKEVFEEVSGDEDFDPMEKNIGEDDSEEREENDGDSNDNDDKEGEEDEMEELPDEEDDLQDYAPKKKKKGKEEEEIFDIDMMDIDKIDELEDMRDKGINISDLSAEINDGDDMSEKPESIDEEESKKITKKPKGKPKKAKKKRSLFSNPKKKKPAPKISSTIAVPLKEEPQKSRFKKKSKYQKGFIDDNADDDYSEERILSKKRNRTNRFEALLKKPKREKLNKNVQILGSRHNPRTIVISKKIYLPEEEESVSKSNDDKALCFNMEQERDTKTIIEKFKQQEKDKKQFNLQDKIISQEDRLLESIFTEWANKNSLKEMKKLDDLNKREATTINKKSFTKYVKIISSQKTKDNEEEEVKDIQDSHEGRQKNKLSLLFSNEDYYNQIFSYFNTKPEMKEKKLCAITGQPAKYYDPLTKSYYSTIDAFKLLRERYFQKEEDGLLFRIQTLSDLASQKKERLKKMILTEDNGTTLNTATMTLQLIPNETTDLNDHKPNDAKTSLVNGTVMNSSANKEPKTNSIINIVNKYGILKNDTTDFDKKVISHRIYNRNRENCLESGMLLEANKQKLIISKKIFKDKFSSKLLGSSVDDISKPLLSLNSMTNKFI